jgi:hypothetical protein
MPETKPKAAIRRFDVFAEYNRLKGKQEGMKADQAKGYGLWLAKVVAAQKFGRLKKPESGKPDAEEAKKKKKKEPKWRDLSGIPQTDKLFEKEIVNRMGKTFYARVFSPSIKEAFTEGKEYREIRDSIRREWKPEK